ncbi:Ubiquitin-conjugating enzyme E2 [Lachnellula hyalina]|uniref:Ubiquitin-conjugating enzyme E2 n=1 Tax=Lachnellula hyalina TaxID=1316788 RepID=A0A8H8R0P4_9HELO|nr:Ubiquitin-conjugating enzyme E2 [Lachnellula hyalina]TVY26298.1 Ubiquitin-conjugating enzyme E2 [Lachnellula hyalina]
MATPGAPRFNSKSPTIKRIPIHNPLPRLPRRARHRRRPIQLALHTARPPSSPYASGIYHGRIILPSSYPLRPPSFRFLTPSGRFEANREICLSISGHHEETWQPAWGIRTALVALRAFMETDAKGQLGGVEMSEEGRRGIAGGTPGWRCGGCGGRSNGEILGEREEAFRAMELEREREGEKAEGQVEVEVPRELQMGFKDEMGKGKEKEKEKEEADTEEAELAEGFVRTADVAPVDESVQPAHNPPPTPTPPQQLPRTSHLPLVPQTPYRAPAPAPLQQLALQPPQPQAHSNDGVPMWIDRAIAGVVVLLVALVLKLLLGL